MAFLRHLVRRSPGACALAAMIALLAVAWAMPEFGAPVAVTATA